jgi:hypothetical protein
MTKLSVNEQLHHATRLSFQVVTGVLSHSRYLREESKPATTTHSRLKLTRIVLEQTAYHTVECQQ